MGKVKLAQAKPDGNVDEKIASSATASAKKSKKFIEKGRIYINASFNNTVITVTDMSGNVIAWATAGSMGFSGPKKATPFASSKVITALSEKIKNSGPKDIEIIVKGVGSGRDSALRSIVNQGFNLISIKDVTPIPHNGPRPPKVRRI